MITEQDVTAARSEVTRASGRQHLLELRADSLAAEDITPEFLSLIGVAKTRVDLAVDRLRKLREGLAAQEAAVAARRAAEVDATLAARRKALSVELETSRERLCATVRTTEDALRELVTASREHDALVRSAAAELAAAGLQLDDHLGHHETGGDAKSGALRLGGRWHQPLAAHSLYMRVAHGVAAQLFGDKHDLTRRLHRFVGVQALDQRLDGLLKSVPVPKPLQSAGTPWRRAEMPTPAEIDAGRRAAAEEAGVRYTAGGTPLFPSILR